MEKGIPIRSISRCLAVLQAINRHRPLTLMEIAQSAGVPYPTACRIVQTLVHDGFIEREGQRKRYRPTELVQSLSTGFQAHDRLAIIARDHMVSLTARLGWPTSIATRVGRTMVVRDSTHAMSSMTLCNYYAGFTMPMLGCASGRAYVAFAPEAERQSILAAERRGPATVDIEILRRFEDEAVLQQIRDEGYATNERNLHNATPGRTASLAAPVWSPDGRLVGALALVFFASAMDMTDAAMKFGGELKAAASRITTDMTSCGRLAA